MTQKDIVVLPFNEEIVQKTIVNTIKKYRYTVKNLMYGRTPIELLDNIFMGDIAKNCIFYLLKSKCNNAHTLIDYDEMRTDNFESADPGWDFIVGNQKMKVEVKSSIPPKDETHENIIRLRDIKITASHNKGLSIIPPESIESHIHIQVYFYAKTYKNGYDDFEKLYEDISQHPDGIKSLLKIEKYSKPLFFGWSTRPQIIDYINTLQPNTWTFEGTQRVYWRCPINKAHTLPQLIEYIEKY